MGRGRGGKALMWSGEGEGNLLSGYGRGKIVCLE